ncbi:MAG: PD40 domain-containing protein [Armatimonadetes bacterium]|nr:PD40 domain-containing protein [Armatimonadota bacterium]
MRGVAFFALIAACGCSFNPAVGPDHSSVSIAIDDTGSVLAFTAADGSVHLLDTKSGAKRRVDTRGHAANKVALSPDGKTLAVVCKDFGPAGVLCVVGADGSGFKRLTDDSGVSDGSPAFSPDGKTIAFSRATRYRRYSTGGMTWDHYDVWTVSPKGTGLKRLTARNLYSVSGCVFWPNGATVVYSGIMPGARKTEPTLFTASAQASMPDVKGRYFSETATSVSPEWESYQLAPGPGDSLTVISSKAQLCTLKGEGGGFRLLPTGEQHWDGIAAGRRCDVVYYLSDVGTGPSGLSVYALKAVRPGSRPWKVAGAEFFSGR